MRTVRRAAAWVAWAAWTCKHRTCRLQSNESGLRPAFFVVLVHLGIFG